jgi:hypothetical protein
MAAVITDPQSSARNVIQPTGDFIPLTLRGNAAQTVPLLQFETSAGAIVGQVAVTGRSQFGDVAINPLQFMAITANVTDTTGTVHGTRVNLRINPASASTGVFQAASSSCQVIVGCSQNFSNTLTGGQWYMVHNGTGSVGAAIGSDSQVQVLQTGSISSAVGGNFRVQNLNAGATITIAVGVKVLSPALTGPIATSEGVRIQNMGGAGVTTARGLIIDNQTGAGTNIAISVGTGNHGFFGATPVAQQTGASAAGIAAITDANAKAAVQALQTALANLGFVTSPA